MRHTHLVARRTVRRAALALGIIASVVSAAACGKGSASDAPAAGALATAAANGTNASANAGANAAPRAPGDTLTDSALIARADRGRLLGRDSGAMWIVMISDFQCPYCKQWHDSTFRAMKRDYIDDGRVRLAYLNLPLAQHPHARAESEAALCAGAQGKFWEYADGLFHQQELVARLGTIEQVLDSLARAHALDTREFARCRKSNAIRAVVESDVQQATRAGVRSTPSFLVGDFLVEGASPYADFRRAIDTALVLARAKAKGTR